MSEYRDNKRIFIDKDEIPKLEKNYDEAFYGKQVLHMVGVIVGGIALAGFNYAAGHPMVSIAIGVAALDFLRADIVEIIRTAKANKQKLNNENEIKESKFIK